MASATPRPFTMDTISGKVTKTEYALWGEEVASHALKLEEELRTNPGSLPFDEILFVNIGNPQALGQKPITYFREVLALCEHSALLHADGSRGLFSSESMQKAKEILDLIPGRTIGANSYSQGFKGLRDAVAAGITQRDGYPSKGDDIFLTDGSSSAVDLMLRLSIKKDKSGILLPRPHHPLYAAAVTLYGGHVVPYHLNEEDGWKIEILDLKRQLESARTENISVSAMVVINPGNPTGQVFDIDSQRAILEFCRKEGLLLLADEVYQDNVYSNNKKFNSFNKIAKATGYRPEDITIVTFHSASNGYYGETGKRGGYMELFGIHDNVKEQINKMALVDTSPNIPGQILMSLVMNPPKVGDSCYERYERERDAVLSSLAQNAKKLQEAFNSLEGVVCNEVEAGMFLFPRLRLPDKAIEAAISNGRTPDTFYARRLLDSTGIVVVPGSGFGQTCGVHIRCSIPPLAATVDKIITSVEGFHKLFMEEYG